MRPVSASDVIAEDVLLQLVAWNAPDHEHTRISLRRQLEEAVDAAIASYEEREQAAQTPNR